VIDIFEFEHPVGVNFRCERCALCCRDTKDRVRRILLLKAEVEHISEKTAMGIDGFAEKVGGFEPYIYRMKKEEDGRCIFLRDPLCSIYEVRPLICRFYPFQLKSLGNNRYIFTYTDECPGMGRGPLLKRNFFKRMFRDFMNTMRGNESFKPPILGASNRIEPLNNRKKLFNSWKTSRKLQD
jgi:Fe-S-cluster containining protein